MDYSTIILSFCFVVIAHGAHLPEVYESNGTKQNDDKYEHPQVFNYEEYQKSQKSNQYDPQRMRYQQQQQANTSLRQGKSTNVQTVSTSSNTSAWNPISTTDSKIVLEDIEKNMQKDHKPKSKIAKKSLNPNIYLVNEEAETIGNRQDESAWINYGNSFNESPTSGRNAAISALSSLLGQTPENQLQGLQHLLNKKSGPLSQNAGAYYKHHTPVNEDVWDSPIMSNKPHNILSNKQNHVVHQALHSLNKQNSSPDTLKSLQAQLDATATAHAESILAEAQKKALEHVRAQHEAIARAQKQAELVALDQIKAKNEALAREQYLAEVAAEKQRLAKAKENDEKRKTAESRRHQEQARERARIAALAYKRKQEAEKRENEANEAVEKQTNAYVVAQNTRSKNAQKHKQFQDYSEQAETQHHYFTTAHKQQEYKPSQLLPKEHHMSIHSESFKQPIAVNHSPIQSSSFLHKPQISSLEHTDKVNHEPESNYNSQNDHAEVEKYYIQPQFTVIGHTKNEHGEPELQYAASYEYGYRIRDYDHGNHYGHKETKDNESTKGEYHTLLPDGRIQTVTYYVDDTGYHAEVSYAGESS